MFCPKCGANNENGGRFCCSCGAELTVAQPQYQQPQYQQPQYQQPQYQQPQYQPQYQNNPYGRYRANITNRSIATCILLSVVTCGIYGIIWFINMVNDLNTASGDTTDANGGTVFLLSLVTCGIYSWVWLYKAGEKVDKIRSYNGEAPSSPGILYIILALFGLGIVDYCLIQSELNKVAAM